MILLAGVRWGAGQRVRRGLAPGGWLPVASGGFGRLRRARPGRRATLVRDLRPGPVGVRAYLTVTVAPAPSRAARALSALSLLTFSSTVLGAPSTRSLASFRPRLVRLRTSLMTWIFLSPAASRMTSNSSCPSACSASPPPAPPAAGAASATGAAALTSNVSSNCLTNSDSSRRVISLNASSRSALLIFAISWFLLFSLGLQVRGVRLRQRPGPWLLRLRVLRLRVLRLRVLRLRVLRLRRPGLRRLRAWRAAPRRAGPSGPAAR